MRMLADINVLIRSLIDDDVSQSRASRLALSSADQVVISRHALCEMVWLLRQRYKIAKEEIVKVIHGYMATKNVIMDTAAVQAGGVPGHRDGPVCLPATFGRSKSC